MISWAPVAWVVFEIFGDLFGRSVVGRRDPSRVGGGDLCVGVHVEVYGVGVASSSPPVAIAANMGAIASIGSPAGVQPSARRATRSRPVGCRPRGGGRPRSLDGRGQDRRRRDVETLATVAAHPVRPDTVEYVEELLEVSGEVSLRHPDGVEVVGRPAESQPTGESTVAGRCRSPSTIGRARSASRGARRAR